MPGWMWLIMGLLFAAALFVFLWGLGTIRIGKERGGPVDLSRAAARGELDLDWSDPRDPPESSRLDSDRLNTRDARTLYERGVIPFAKKPLAPPLNPSNRST